MPQVATFERAGIDISALHFVLVDAHGRPVAAFRCGSDAAMFRNQQHKGRNRVLHLKARPHTFDPKDKATDRRNGRERRAFSQRRSGLDRRRPEAR